MRAEGVAGLYKGLAPTMARQGGNSMIRFAVFRNMQALWQAADADADAATSTTTTTNTTTSGGGASVSPAKSFLSGMMAGTVATSGFTWMERERERGGDISMYLLTHSLTHPLTHPLTHSLTHSWLVLTMPVDGELHGLTQELGC